MLYKLACIANLKHDVMLPAHCCKTFCRDRRNPAPPNPYAAVFCNRSVYWALSMQPAKTALQPSAAGIIRKKSALLSSSMFCEILQFKIVV